MFWRILLWKESYMVLRLRTATLFSCPLGEVPKELPGTLGELQPALQLFQEDCFETETQVWPSSSQAMRVGAVCCSSVSVTAVGIASGEKVACQHCASNHFYLLSRK
jgi:hypothetical protein